MQPPPQRRALHQMIPWQGWEFNSGFAKCVRFGKPRCHSKPNTSLQSIHSKYKPVLLLGQKSQTLHPDSIFYSTFDDLTSCPTPIDMFLGVPAVLTLKDPPPPGGLRTCSHKCSRVSSQSSSNKSVPVTSLLNKHGVFSRQWLE